MTQDELKSDLAAAIKQLAEQSREAIVDCVMERLRSINLLVPEGWQAVPTTDLHRLLIAAESDETLIWCETCGAWLDSDDPALATTADYVGCWKVAASEKDNGNNCRSYRLAFLPAKPGDQT